MPFFSRFIYFIFPRESQSEKRASNSQFRGRSKEEIDISTMMNSMWTRQPLSSRTAKRILSAIPEYQSSSPSIQLPTRRAWNLSQNTTTRNTAPSRHFSSINRQTTTGYYSQRASPASPSNITSRLRFSQHRNQNQNHTRFRFNRRSNHSNANADQASPNSFSARWKKLSKEYGWAAVGIYLALSALDFPFCFAAVRLLGVERIGYFEHVIVDSVKSVIGRISPLPGGEDKTDGDGTGAAAMVDGEDAAYDHGVVEAQERNSGEEASMFLSDPFLNSLPTHPIFMILLLTLFISYLGIWTQLALAYAIHKSFIFIRIPLTVAVTPKIVKILKRWGWDIGKKATPKGK